MNGAEQMKKNLCMELKRGDKVRVVKQGLKTTGLIGIVKNFSYHLNEITVEVEVPDWGILSYNSKSLRLDGDNIDNIEANEGDNNMLMGKYTVCKVKFIEGINVNKEYHYALYDDNICIDDYVVVKSANHGFGIARVVDIIPDGYVTQTMRDYCNEGREVVAAFDMGAYEGRVNKRKMAKQLKADMNKKMKEMQELAMFEMMAEKNPELKEMLDKYKELID